MAKHFDKAKVQVATLPKKTLIITVLGKTIDIQSELDPLFDAVEKNILQIEQSVLVGASFSLRDARAA
ncbi:hypothetical protein F9K33_04525 [bacterium]|nr:MAG: hypothetical protein F9K33_04525 [bacterium]